MVLLSLVWWGCALGTSALWTASVKDVARVMEGMVEGIHKRVGEAASSSRVKWYIMQASDFFPITNINFNSYYANLVVVTINHHNLLSFSFSPPHDIMMSCHNIPNSRNLHTVLHSSSF